MKRTLIAAILLGSLAFGQGTKIPTYKELKYPPMGQVKIPEPVQATLSNGMRVFLLENHELPLISGSVMVRTGNLFDPADKKGLSSIMAEVMRSGGTKAKSGDQLDVELENIAASVESGMDETSASVSFSALKESTDTALAIFKEVLTNPEFRQDKIDLSITQARSGIARRNDEPDGIADRELQRILYGPNTPYGWQVEYTDLANIHREDLQAFYRRYYFPKNMMLEVYGDFNAAEMKDKLEKLFADWKVEQPAVPAFPKVTAPAAPGVYLAEKPDVTQTFFSIGELGGVRSDPDYASLEVAANILGEGFTSRLVKEVRTKLGYAYNIAAVWSAQWDHPGTFRIVGSTKSMTTIETIQAIQTELQKIRMEPVTDKELQDAKDAALNGFVFNFASPAQTLSRAVRYEYYGYPKDFVFTYQKALGAVTKADVLRVAQARFKPENLAIVTVGNPKDFGKQLSTVGKVMPIDLTIPEPKQEIAAGDAASQDRGKALLARAAQAMGGTDKLAAVKDWTRSLSMVMEPSAGGITVKETTRIIGADQFRQDQELPFGKMAVYSDGKTGWLATPQGTMAMPAEILKQARGETFRGLASVLLSSRDTSRTVNAVGQNTVQVSTTDGLSVKIDFDAATGLPASESYQEAGQNGAPSEVMETFSDWRDSGGIKVPFKVVLQQDGKKAGEATVATFQFNTGLKTEDLAKKP
ncbi:MAG TPA: pitrilysin family protein [Bryobacteraceae bacterium]|jgi:zinc protease